MGWYENRGVITSKYNFGFKPSHSATLCMYAIIQSVGYFCCYRHWWTNNLEGHTWLLSFHWCQPASRCFTYSLLPTVSILSHITCSALKTSWAAISLASRRVHSSHFFYIFSARQHAERAICYRKSICPSVTRVDQSKTVEARIMQFSPYSSPIPLVFAG